MSIIIAFRKLETNYIIKVMSVLLLQSNLASHDQDYTNETYILWSVTSYEFVAISLRIIITIDLEINLPKNFLNTLPSYLNLKHSKYIKFLDKSFYSLL